MLDMSPQACHLFAPHGILSNDMRYGAHTDSDLVMADQTTHHVVNSDRSTGEQSSVDAYARQFHNAPALVGNHSTAATSHDISSTSTDAATDNSRSADQNISTAKVTNDGSSTAEQRLNGLAHLSANGGQDGNNSADEVLGGSDTDTSRAGSFDQSKEENSNLRSNSVKKPTSFKPVSVTKTFLAKTTGTTAPPALKVGEKSPVISNAQPVAKPRLVMKSGSALRDNLPRTRSGDGVGAPDGRKVWNKNQPVPPPPPKQFTDEELKQQYGIHLASRLQEDEQDGKSKWADIDDEDEDWTPETVEWMDGTKSSINAADQQAAAAAAAAAAEAEAEAASQEAAKAAEKRVEEQAPPVKPTLTALKRAGAASSSTTKTILRPGAAQQAKQNGLGSMSAADKQTLVAKANMPTPVKSPWAPLPPVDKAPPLVVNPPSMPQHQQQPSRFGQRDPHGFDAFNGQPEPAREIATDTFDRSQWRENERANRELFNSQSGRYEPAPEYRRPSRQQDNTRQPAVLQRTSQQNASGPAEPSAAFQTRSSAQMDGSSYSRRRGSSFSGAPAITRDRRMSTNKPSDLPASHDESLPEAVAPPQPEAAANLAVQQHVISPPVEEAVPVTTLEDEVARQKKVLQESREAAKRRKQEEWEREEADKKERIRKRLEALAEQQTARSSPASTSAQPETSTEPVKSPSKDPAALPSPQIATAEAPRPEAHVSDPSPVHRASPKKQRLVEQPPAPFSPTQIPFSTRSAPKPSYEEPQLPGLKQQSPQLNTRMPYQRQPSGHGVSTSNFSSPGDHKAQPARMPGIQNLPNADGFPLWGNGGMAAHTAAGSNVWGPPTSNRHIGNGTFDTGYSRISSGQLPQHQNVPFSSPAPFARQYNSRLPSQGLSDQQLGPMPNIESRVNEPTVIPQINGTSPLPETARPAYQPAPIAPPQKAGSRLQHQQPRDTSAWTNFANQAHQRDRDETARLVAEKNDGQPSPQQRWTETFKQTQVEDGWLGGPRKLVSTEKTVRGNDVAPRPHSVVSPAPPVAQTSIAHHIASPGSSMHEQRYSPGESTVRLPTGPSSLARGFGSPAGNAGLARTLSPLSVHSSNVQPLPPMPMTPTSAPQQSRFFPSALYGGSPPPEEADHPVRRGDIRHPHVKLPMSRPKVKLPPASSTSQSKPGSVIMPQRLSSAFRAGVGAQPLVANSDWQARFNGLFGRAQINTTTPPSPPKTPPKSQTPSPAVAAASKVTIDFVPLHRASTTVSLPQTRPARFEAISKPGVDDIFDGELSFGSTPRVFLPRGAQYAESFANGPDLGTPRQNSRFNKPVEARSKAELPASFLEDPKAEVIRMKLPKAWATAKEIPFLRKPSSKPTPQGRKVSAKVSKNKRNVSGANLSAASASDSPKTSSPASRGAASRNQSFQKSQTPVPEQAAKTPSSAVGPVIAGEENAPKKSNWAKTSRGPPRGKPSNKGRS